MSYDTEHVRNAGDTLGMVIGISTFAELLENPSLASIYRRSRPSASGLDPVEEADIQ